MYDRPPPVDSLEWSFGLMIDVCARLGMGRNDNSQTKWEIKDYIKNKDLPLDESTARNWLAGGGISEPKLEQVIKAFTQEEKYQEVWEEVIRRSANFKSNRIDIQKEREKIFHIDVFSNDKSTDDLINEYLSNAPVIYSIEELNSVLKEGVQKPRNSLKDESSSSNTNNPIEKSLSPKPWNKIWVLIPIALVVFLFFNQVQKSNTIDYRDLNLKKLIFKNIQFCSEPNFDHDLNRCLKDESVFPQGIDKVNISFESDVLPEDARFSLRWYRYGEIFSDKVKNWTETFAHDLKYASTFYRPPNGFRPGLYQVRFYMKDNIIGEGQFRVEK